MKWDENDLIFLSALQHYVFCPRQCALIHVEQVWEENIFTLRGRRLHENVDLLANYTEGEIKVELALPLWSERLGLIGKADVVEFLPDGTPYPVEYKVGTRKNKRADEVQLCAQGMCLEEMFGLYVPRGAIYYHSSRRRREVYFTPELRSLVEKVVEEVRQLLREEYLPPPLIDKRCRDCSLNEVCLPDVLHNLPIWLEREWK